jgi:hypothetical protein
VKNSVLLTEHSPPLLESFPDISQEKVWRGNPQLGIVGHLRSKSYQKAIKKLLKGYQKAIKRLSKSYQKALMASFFI